MKFRKRPPGVEEWDGFMSSADGFDSEEEYYEDYEELLKSTKLIEEYRKANNVSESLFNEDGSIKWLSKVPSRICSCCGKPLRIKPYCHEVCRNCGWKDDKKQAADPELRGESNEMSLNEAKRAFKNGEKIR